MLYYFILFLLPIQALSFTLITFDVDGTLVKGSGRAASESAHARAFGHAVSNILGDGDKITPVANALPRHLYHGSTDGLILLRLARATLDVQPEDAYEKLDQMFDCMYEYIRAMDNEEISDFITPLPGVIDQLNNLAAMKDRVVCGLVTGNVEGVARKKMDAVGILSTNALSPPCQSQKIWDGSEHLGFLGGFGSDYCSGDIDNLDRNYLDRGEQIAIATERCRTVIGDNSLKRVVHVGDAPADVLAAKWYSEQNEDASVCVGMVAVATGSYPAEELTELAGEPIPGKWEPVVLQDGMADPSFFAACGVSN